MTSRFIHTADWQLGKPFARIDDNRKRSLLQNERIAVLQRIAQAVLHTQAQFVLVAGDLFDSPNADKSTVAAACAAIGSMKVPVLVIPGNHDHGGPGSLWEQDFFLSESGHLASNLQVLLKPEPVELPHALILPCPLVRRRESTDPTAWIRSLDPALLAGAAAKPRIVLAHGTVQVFGATTGADSEDDDDVAGLSNFIDLSRLPMADLDYVALGDWHGMKQVGTNAWYSGTPELDRFQKGEDHRPGHILAVTASRGQPAHVQVESTGGIRWHQLDFDLAGDDALATLRQRMDDLVGPRVDKDLVRLSLTGSLGIEASRQLERLYDSWEARLLRLKRHDSIRIAPSPEEIEALTRRAADPLISWVAASLVARVAAGDDSAPVAALALRELHAACTHH